MNGTRWSCGNHAPVSRDAARVYRRCPACKQPYKSLRRLEEDRRRAALTDAPTEVARAISVAEAVAAVEAHRSEAVAEDLDAPISVAPPGWRPSFVEVGVVVAIIAVAIGVWW